MDEQETPGPAGQRPGTSMWSDQPVVRPPLGVRQPAPPPAMLANPETDAPATEAPATSPETESTGGPKAAAAERPGHQQQLPNDPSTPAPAAPAPPASRSPFAAPANTGPAATPIVQQPYADQQFFAASAQRDGAGGISSPLAATAQGQPGQPVQPGPDHRPGFEPGPGSATGPDPGASQPPPKAPRYDPFARPSQPPPGEPPTPAGPTSPPPGDGGGRRPLLIAGSIALVMILATVGWLLLGNRDQPVPPPESPSQTTEQPSPGPGTDSSSASEQPSSASSSPSDEATEDGSGIPYQDSTRTPPWTATRDEPRVGMAPVSQPGEPAEVIEAADEHGLVTIIEHVWSDGEGNRTPAEGMKFLLLHVEIEAFDGPFSYAPGRFVVIDQEHGRYDFMYASAMQEKYPLIHNGDLPEGKVLNGWVMFELPQQDVVVSYQAYSEEGLRVELPGGPSVPHSTPDIALGDTFTESSSVTSTQLRIDGASWFSQALSPPPPGKEYLAVKVTFEVTEGDFFASPVRFRITDAGGNRIETFPVTGASIVPSLIGSTVAEGDSYTGWIYFEVERADVTLLIESANMVGEVPISGA